jgi:histone-binding protein RBBP4
MAGGSSPASPPQSAASVEEMEEFLNWKKDAAVLYDLVISHPLEWPLLTVQWLPSESSTRSHRLVAGTHTSGGAVPAPSVSVSRVAPHRGEVNRARCMPQRPYTVATKTCVDEVHVYHLGDGSGSGSSRGMTPRATGWLGAR